MPIPDARQQLFDAAERVLHRDGPNGLTSRAIAGEAAVSKGLIHRHFADVDALLTELVLDRIARLNTDAQTLLGSVGTATIPDNLTGALVALFSPLTVAIVGLIIARDSLRTRLRQAGSAQIPLLGEGTVMIRDYLTAEQTSGRLSRATDVRTVAPTLIGAVHLLCTERQTAPPARAEVTRIVRAVIGGA